MRTWLLLLVVSIPAFARAAEREGELGLVAQKPAEGMFVATDRGYMVPYKIQVPEIGVAIEMVPIPGGSFLFGSAESEPRGRNDEGPAVKVDVPPFWMAKYEISWGNYKPYMESHIYFREATYRKVRPVTSENKVDAVTGPTQIYAPNLRFIPQEDDRYPAMSMTQYAAKQYSKWLSRMTGEQYRLPFEAEWEYACRAGSSKHYHFGDAAERLEKYAWFQSNSYEEPHFVGTKLPNAFGLHDMHGNVAEWVLDQYSPDGYTRLKKLAQRGKRVSVLDSFRQPDEITGRVVRGGGYVDNADMCRSASRLAHDEELWKEEDADIPTSTHWLANGDFMHIGFRIMRPLDRMTDEKAVELGIWDAKVKKLIENVETRIVEGRGSIGLVDETFPAMLSDYIEAREERRRIRERLREQKNTKTK